MLFKCENSNFGIFSYIKLSGSGHADNFSPLSGDPSKLQVSLDRLNDSIGMFGIPFASPKCKISLHGWVGSKPNLVLEEEWGEVDRLSYLSSRISVGGHISDQASSRTQKN